MLEVELKDRAEVRLKIARTGKSLRQFAEMIGISQGYLSQVLVGRNNPSPRIAYKIAEGLSVPIDELFIFKFIDTTVKQEVQT